MYRLYTLALHLGLGLIASLVEIKINTKKGSDMMFIKGDDPSCITY